MKKLLILVLLLLPVFASAQTTGRLINRIDRQNGSTPKGVLNGQDAVQDNKPKQAVTNPKIVAIYPTPLVQGSSIKVKVSSPRESNLSYSIYDALGRVVALGVTRQHIGIGDNTVSISTLDGLVNGSYLLKLNFGDGSSDTHFFQVLR